MICDEDGGILDDLVVYRLAQEHFLVVANASNVRVVLDALHQRVAGFDTELRDASDAWALIAMQGPTSAEIVAGLTDLDVSSVKYYSIDRGTLAALRPPGPNRLHGRGRLRGLLRLCEQPRSGRPCPGRRPHGLVPAGLACRDTLRLEAGMPLYGQELSRDVTPFEAGLGRVVSFDKEGGFVGDRALVVRRDAGDDGRWSAWCPRPALPPHGLRRRRPGHRRDRRRGHQRCAVAHPRPPDRDRVRRGRAPGARHPPAVDIRGAHEDVEVVALPFYRRPA